jgi:hypothetical protein
MQNLQQRVQLEKEVGKRLVPSIVLQSEVSKK